VATSNLSQLFNGAPIVMVDGRAAASPPPAR
jgi:hypothetical protein